MEWLSWVSDPQIWISLVTLTVLEIVLGIDNIIFIAILAGKLPADQQKKARTLGLGLALITRVLLLLAISWLASLRQPIHPSFAFGAHLFSWRDVVLIAGGLFLLWKSVHEIHGNLEGEEHSDSAKAVRATLSAVIAQIIVVDIVFSLDSVITAVGMTNQVPVMIAAVVLAMVVMMLASGAISAYVNRHPTIKMLALSFLILVGVMLVAEGVGQHVSKGYIYFAMAFSFAVEMLNIRAQKKAKKPVELRKAY